MIGAQQAFSGTLSGVVTNVVALILNLIVMLSTSWIVTVLASYIKGTVCPPGRSATHKEGDEDREIAGGRDGAQDAPPAPVNLKLKA